MTGQPRHTFALGPGDPSCWDDMERILHHSFHNELRVAPDEHGVVMTQHPFAPPAQRRHLAELMFETFHVSAYLGQQATLSLFCSGRLTGLVLDSGHEVTHAVPIYEGLIRPGRRCRCTAFGHRRI